MLASWTNTLPVFVVKWLARKHCGYTNIQGVKYFYALDDVLVKENK